MSSTSKAASGSSDQKKPRQDITKNKGKVGDWVRHTSSSGKEYYYNVISHASQWEKPREWLDHEQRYGPVPNVPAGSSRAQPTTIAKVQQQHTSATQSQQQHDRERDREHHHQLHQQQQREREQAQRDRYHHHQHQHPGPSTSSNYTHAWTAAVAHHQHHNIHSSSSSTVSTSSSRHYTETRQLPTSSAALSSNHGVRDSRKPSEDMQSEDMDISPLDEESSVTIDTSGAGRSQSQQPGSNMSTIISGPSTTTYGNRNSERERERERDRDRDREKERDDRDRDSYRSSYHIRDRDRDRLRGDTRDSPRRDIDRYRERDRNDRDRGGDRNDRGRGRERDREREWEKDRRDRSRSKLRDERSRSPQWDKDRTPERQGDSSSMSLGSIDTAKKEDIPDLPSSMAVYFREDLISHVKNLPGDALERQANKLMEELLTINSVQLSKVSSELKMARSLVRLTDIQSTLQEQKILFLRQQIKDLEDSESSTCLGIDMPNL